MFFLICPFPRLWEENSPSMLWLLLGHQKVDLKPEFP